ncbi:hypothetical protein D9M68_815550 [compost metagenome]
MCLRLSSSQCRSSTISDAAADFSTSRRSFWMAVAGRWLSIQAATAARMVAILALGSLVSLPAMASATCG